MVLTADEIRAAWAEAEEIGRTEEGMEKLMAESFANPEAVDDMISEIAADCAVSLVNAGLVHPQLVHDTATHMKTGVKFGLLIADRATLRRNRK